MFLNLATIAPLTAAGMSAELNTMNGAFPPNSSDTLLTVSAQPAIKNYNKRAITDGHCI